jgi:hypothetical protein
LIPRTCGGPCAIPWSAAVVTRRCRILDTSRSSCSFAEFQLASTSSHGSRRIGPALCITPTPTGTCATARARSSRPAKRPFTRETGRALLHEPPALLRCMLPSAPVDEQPDELSSACIPAGEKSIGPPVVRASFLLRPLPEIPLFFSSHRGMAVQKRVQLHTGDRSIAVACPLAATCPVFPGTWH